MLLTAYALLFALCVMICSLFIVMPPSKKEGHIAFHMLVGQYVSLTLIVQLLTPEHITPQPSNLVGR